MARGEHEGRRVVDVAGERVIDGAGRRGLSLQADAAGEVGLRVHIDQQHALVVGNRQRRREIDCCGGLADAALLIGDGKDACWHFGQNT